MTSKTHLSQLTRIHTRSTSLQSNVPQEVRKQMSWGKERLFVFANVQGCSKQMEPDALRGGGGTSERREKVRERERERERERW